ncbi:MAG: carboxypeptidase-like regulatory domain-containing protein, partial [Bacteroidia bacterium]|nr:carboxypeptidase-like regulatory domain-containing protein [Bacteroidia bacterium]
MKQTLVTFIFFLFAFISYAAKVTGVVTDNSGILLPYASVFIKGSNKGTNANSGGEYSIYLEPGQYTLICQHVGYKREEKMITVTSENMEVDFVLSLQEMTLGEVILTIGNNPANEIIRNAIKQRSYYQEQLNKFQCQVYTKGQLRIRNYPKKILGRKVDFEDGDTSKQKMLYLSETISTYSVDKPNKEKIVVHSSRVSGRSDGYGLSAPQFISLYDNNVFIGN